MEIYKIKDFEKVSQKDAAGAVGMGEIRITDIRQAVKNENRVNVFVNDKYSFSLDISQVVEFHLKKGQVITAEQLEEYKKASEFGKLYQRTLEWALSRPHSEREVRDYLYRKLKNAIRGSKTWASAPERSREGHFELPAKSLSEDNSEVINDIISRLVSRGYVNDESFARWYVENRFVKKGISQKRLKMELIKKGIAKEIIDEVLDARNDEEEILKIIAKKRAKYDDEKLISYLCRQGFQYELVQNLVRSYEKD